MELISRPPTRLTRTSLVDSATLIGMGPRRPFSAQDVIRTTDLETPVMVTKNSMVIIRLQTDRMQLTVQGRALDDGADGDDVRVMNSQSNNVVSAAVVASGAVAVLHRRSTGPRGRESASSNRPKHQNQTRN